MCAALYNLIVMNKEVRVMHLKLSASPVRIVGIDSIHGFCIFN